MCGNTFNMTEIEVTERSGNFPNSQAWIGHNARGYHNFNVLPHTIPYIFTQFSMVLGLFATRYHALPSNL